MILLIIAFAIGVLTLLTSFCGFCIKWFTLAWASGAVLSCECKIIPVTWPITVGLSLAALLVAFFNGYQKENRQLLGPTGSGKIYTQEYGYAFWCCLAGTAVYLLTVILSFCVAIATFVHARHADVGGAGTSQPFAWKNGHTMV